jgi:AraC-like DNA-binding protein
MQNRRACEYCNASEESETLGRTDADYWSDERAAHYVEGDQMVIRSAKPILNQLAPAPEEAGSNSMIIYSKFPVKDHLGNVVGIAGIHRLINESSISSTPLGPLFRAVRRIHEAYASDLKMTELAQLTGLSNSQFARRFKAALGVAPKEYLLRVRVRKSCGLLETTNDTIVHIAHQCGFYDHSHFSHAFRRHTGQSPTRYRSEHINVTS